MNNNNENAANRRKPGDTHKRVSVFAALIFFGFIILADSVLLFDPSRVISDNENRVLAQAPELSLQKLSSGKFMTQFEDFVSDQFMARDGWISAKLKMDKMSGKKESNGVYLGSRGYLFEAAQAPDTELVAGSMNAVNSFAARHSGIKVVMSIIPNAVSVINEFFPHGAPSRDQLADINAAVSQLAGGAAFVDVYDVLRSHAGEQLYYKGDHHWTSLGAKYAFEVIAPALGVNDIVRNWNVMAVTDDFSGTMSSASGSFNTVDTIEIYTPEQEMDYYVEYSGDPVKYSSIYNSSALDSKNKYEVFLGGNHPRISITTLNNTGKNLMVIKDSYANCFIQFLLPFFDKIVIVDPRYYSDDLEVDIAANEINEVLLLYNANTFFQDSSLAGVLNPENLS